MTAIRTRVRCGGALHHVAIRRGALVLDDHPDIEAERALMALGAPAPPCVRVLDTWRRGTIGLLPARLRSPAIDAARTAHARWCEQLPRADPPRRVRKLLERECKGLLAESLRAAGCGSPVSVGVSFLRGARWPDLWNGWLSTEHGGSISVALNVGWCERVHHAGLGLIDGHFVVDVLGDDLVLAVRWRREAARPARWKPAITVARMAIGGTWLAWYPFTLRHVKFDDANGEAVHGAGFDAPDRQVVKVAGVSFRADALQSPTVAPIQPLSLVPEPSNPADPCAVGVWDARQEAHVGYVPRDEAGPLSAALSRGETWHAVSMWEWWRDDGRRLGLKMLLVRAPQRGSSWNIGHLSKCLEATPIPAPPARGARPR